MKSNFERMLQLIDEVFATRTNPGQLRVTENVIEKLQSIHPSTLSELDEGNGPCIWILLIPTTLQVMHDFIGGKISEQKLFDCTLPGQSYQAVYLCSASALPEYRGKGLSKKLCVSAVKKIQKDHPIKVLYYWPFTKEGEQLAHSVAGTCGLELLEKE